MALNIIVVGTGYVGLVTGACLADAGHNITCVDIDQTKIKRLQDGNIPIFEPGLEQIVKHNVEAKRLTFTTDLISALPKAEVIFIAVGTPALPDGRANLEYVYTAAETIGQHLNHYVVVVDKSTVPVGTALAVEQIIKKNYTGEFAVASCPEFLREGNAVDDFFAPDRIVIGVRNQRAADVLLEVFKPIQGQKLVTAIESAELIKYASNAFLATKISFINEIAQICERTGADIEEVSYGVGLDRRIGPNFLKAGIGWGGSCFPKDVVALDQMAGDGGYDFKLLKGVISVNQEQRAHFVNKIKNHFNNNLQRQTLAVLGLAFKDNTDDIRESAAIDIVQQLVTAGAIVNVFDYKALTNSKMVLKNTVKYCTSPEEAVKGAQAVLVLTEWKEFKALDWRTLKQTLAQPVIFDGRNLLKPATMCELGFDYHSIGR
ncbi:MAG: UDP-glucose/GDP-mannose dehydrogenase family protein [Patescibacteria group bacterium]|jgi:UDPglucose 6-dehydrogenase